MAATRFVYQLDVEIEPVDIDTVVDGLSGESLAVRALLGDAELIRRLKSGHFKFERVADEAFIEFERDVAMVSVYVPEYVVGREVRVEPTRGAPVLEGWKVIGRLGETARLKLDLAWDPREGEIVDRDEDLGDAARRWRELPEWVRDALRVKYPGLRAL